VRSELTNKIEAAENRLHSKIEVLKSDLRSGFSALGAVLEHAVLCHELSSTREIAALRIRVERLEKNVVSCSIVEGFLAAKRRLTHHFCMLPPAGDARFGNLKFSLYSLPTRVEYDSINWASQRSSRRYSIRVAG
jgi:hypothetical protein